MLHQGNHMAHLFNSNHESLLSPKDYGERSEDSLAVLIVCKLTESI